MNTTFKEEIRVRGKTRVVDAIEADGKVVTLTGWPVKTGRVKDEWYGDAVTDPDALVDGIRRSGCNVDLLTFVQWMPHFRPMYSFPLEPVPLAVLQIRSYADWFNCRISRDVRKKLRKAERAGVVCKAVPFDDRLAAGITEIYNESPVRQGRAFWHYGKSFETIRAEAATYADKSQFIGAYSGAELVGFIKLVYLSDTAASTMHVIAKIKDREKAPTNALLAKAVQVCAERGIGFLSYGEWSDGTLGDFKRHSGFEKMELPRYYVPVSGLGRAVLRCNLHKGIAGVIPDSIRKRLIAWRRVWVRQRVSHA